MTITQMQYFVAVCEYGTISKSAEILHISQPSISLAIRDWRNNLELYYLNVKINGWYSQKKENICMPLRKTF